MDAPEFVETFGNAESEQVSTAVMGFTQTRDAWGRWRADLSSEWTSWEVKGNAGDYVDNATFALHSGFPFNLNNG